MSKYRNVRTAVDGIVFASKREARRYMDLKNMERANVIERLELQPRYKMVIGGMTVCTFVPDFQYRHRETGELVIEDAKGVQTAVYKMKKKLLKAIYGLDVVEV